MPMKTAVVFVPHVVGIGLDPGTGNPCINGEDKATGDSVTIVIEAQYWKLFIENCQRLKGVGISVPVEGAVDLSGIGRNGDVSQ